MAVDAAHGDDVVAGARADVGRAGVRGEHREIVIARAERDVEDLEIAVDDAARQRAAGDHRVATHAEAREVATGQHADVVRRAVAVEHVQRVDLVGLVDARVEVHRPVEVLVAGKRLVELARLDHGDVARRRDLSRGDEALVREIDHDQRVAFRAGGEGDGAARLDVVRELARHVGDALAGLHDVGMRGDERAVVEHDRPHLAGEHVGRLQLHERRLAGCRRARRVLERERLAGAVDDEQPRALGERGELLGRVHVDVGRERPCHLSARIPPGNDVGVLCGESVDQQHHGDVCSLGRSAVDGGGERDRSRSGWLQAQIRGERSAGAGRLDGEPRYEGSAAPVHDHQRAAFGSRGVIGK